MLTTVSRQKPPENPPVEPQEIVGLAETRLRSVSELQGMPVFCRFHEGILSIHGRVNSFHAKQLAQTAAAGLPGVIRLQNCLEVK